MDSNKRRKRKITKKPSAKKSRKQEYGEKHEQKNLNPDNLTESGILNDLLEKRTIAGPPPAHRRCTSAQWKMGMKFLFDAETKKEILNWYYCEICGWLCNAVLGGGTANLLKHAQSHVVNKTYKLTKAQLVEALTKASKYTSSTADIPDYANILPAPENWLVHFFCWSIFFLVHSFYICYCSLKFLICQVVGIFGHSCG